MPDCRRFAKKRMIAAGLLVVLAGIAGCGDDDLAQTIDDCLHYCELTGKCDETGAIDERAVLDCQQTCEAAGDEKEGLNIEASIVECARDTLDCEVFQNCLRGRTK
ncbi:MAG: hypothetical protein C4523_01795 [Myxococcales bacterium]|nr:MAG: hypothetical protein C4523_01795 [Myxococcales bacterium]